MFFRVPVAAIAIALLSQLIVVAAAPSPQLMRPQLHVYDIIDSEQPVPHTSASSTPSTTTISELGAALDDAVTSSHVKASPVATDIGTSFIEQSNSGTVTANAGMGAALLVGTAILTLNQLFLF